MVNSDWSGEADVLVRDGRVVGIVEPGAAAASGATEIDARGRLVLPGGVDPHCHVGFTSGAFTSLDNYEEATTAAVFGGTTTIVDFAIPLPGETPTDAVERQRPKAATGLCDSALHGCVVSWDDTVPRQLEDLMAGGIVTFKMFTTYRGETMADEDTILGVMKTLARIGGMVVIHCEANHIIEDAQRDSASREMVDASHLPCTRPELAEEASVAEVLAIAEAVDAPVYFVHQSTPGAVDRVRRARERGVRAWSEAVTHHLVLDQAKYEQDRPERFVCCPPLRSRRTVDGLRRRLLMGQIDTIGSDHCCYDSAQKAISAHDVRVMPNGLPGVEHRLPVIFSEFVVPGHLPVESFVALTSANPARLNGLYPRKGVIAPGSDADIVVWAPDRSSGKVTGPSHMKTDYSPYEGLELSGSVDAVLVAGRVRIQHGELVDGEPGGVALSGTPLPANT